MVSMIRINGTGTWSSRRTEAKMGKDLYEAVEKDTFTPGAG